MVIVVVFVFTGGGQEDVRQLVHELVGRSPLLWVEFVVSDGGGGQGLWVQIRAGVVGSISAVVKQIWLVLVQTQSLEL